MSNEDRAHSEFLAQWQVAIEDIRIAKRQQWLTMFYGISVQSGIIIFLNKMTERSKPIILSSNEKFVFIMLSIVTFLILPSFLFYFQHVQQTCRKTILKIQPSFTPDFHQAGLVYDKTHSRFSVNWPILILFIFGLFMSMAIVIWFLCRVN